MGFFRFLRPKITGTGYYQTSQSAGFDFIASERAEIGPGERRLIGTGAFISPGLSSSYELQIRPRSGLALKAGITVLNSPGTVDIDFTSEIKVLLINHSNVPFQVKVGDRIAQGVVCKTYKARGVLTLKNKRQGGFGSTGVGSGKS